MSYRKKLIEVALPLDAINAASAREKSIRHGHPSTLHLWWARRPLAACRAVLFSSMVDDPAEDGAPAEYLELLDRLEREWKIDRHHHGEGDAERRRAFLFDFLSELVTWENSTNEPLLRDANALICACAPNGTPPPVLDPFSGGGSIPLEAQRLGLDAHGSDINPVAVLISKAGIEIPPQWRGCSPVHPDSNRLGTGVWSGTRGLAEDVRRYGDWVLSEARKKLEPFYPPIEVTPAMAQGRPDLKQYIGKKLQVNAWLWARTVPSPNPAARGAKVPLIRSFSLATKKGKEAWVEPVVDRGTMTYTFTVKTRQSHPVGAPSEGTVNREGVRCLLTASPMSLADVRELGQAGKIGSRLMAIVAEGERGRVYLPPTDEQSEIARQARPVWRPDTPLPKQALGFRVQGYGMTVWADLFTERQLLALSTFADLVPIVRDRVQLDACEAGLSCEEAASYANAVATYLGFGVSRMADMSNALCSWGNTDNRVRHLFTRQAISINFDYGETNPLIDAAGGYSFGLDFIAKAIANAVGERPGKLRLLPVQEDVRHHPGALISSDPPYYDNVPYADLSDFFYVWLRRALGSVHPDLLNAESTPKDYELVADLFRRGSREAARKYFEEGMTRFFEAVCAVTPAEYPASLIYAFKQQDTDADSDDAKGRLIEGGQASTGWETFLQGLVDSGLAVTATWPLRTELANRMRGQNSNALAGSIVLTVRPRPENAPSADRLRLTRALKSELPDALRDLTKGGLPPVDLAQAAIGPGMAIYSRFKYVNEPSGEPMKVRGALRLINQVLAEVLEEGDGDLDLPTRFALSWFSHVGFRTGTFGDAEKFATGKNIPVKRVQDAGLLIAKGGDVRLLRMEELDPQYDPAEDESPTLWEAVHHLAKRQELGGVKAAGALLRRYRDNQPKVNVDLARDLAYRLYAICDGKRWAAEARPYNALASEWLQIEDASQEDAAAWGSVGGEANLFSA